MSTYPVEAPVVLAMLPFTMRALSTRCLWVVRQISPQAGRVRGLPMGHLISLEE